VAHHRARRDDGQRPEYSDEPAQYAPPPPTQADELEHLAQLHTSGVLTDEEFASAKAKVIGS
jgi:Short C-terminal domain